MESDDPKTPLRRGRGMRLSTHTPVSDEATPAGGDEPIVRGRGLHLTTEEQGSFTPWQHLATQTSSGRVNYYCAGEGPPLLLLHGFGASGRIWRGVADGLGHTYTCYAPDMPGFGASPPRRAAPTLDSLADDILAFADALGLEQFALLGHSLGSAVAAVIAGRWPERITRLALTSIAVRPFAPELITLAANRLPLDLSFSAASPMIDLWRPWTEWMMVTPPAALLIGSQVLAAPPAEAQLWQEYLADHARADGRAYITSVASQGDPVLKASLSAITTTTLLIVGREDRVARLPDVELAQGMIAGGQLAVIEGCGHMPLIERPAEYQAILAAFFAAGDP